MDLLLSSNNDLLFTKGDLTLTADEATEIAQRLQVNLRTFRGESFMDDTIGMPYIQRIFKKNTSVAVVTSLFREAILLDPAVSEIMNFAFSFDSSNRTLTLSFSVKTINNSIVTIPEFIINE